MIKNIVIQAGGKGTRLEKYTRNKPKCLVPVNNLPILFYAFKKFPNAKFHVICDYQHDVLEKYLAIFADNYDYRLIKTERKGTCAGVREALRSVGEQEPFLFMWSDLILAEAFSLPAEDGNYIGISKDFECRWSFHDDRFLEKPSKEDGVAGLFVFENSQVIQDVPQEGGFVEYLSGKQIGFTRIDLYGTREVGTILSYNEYNDDNKKCRPFNRIAFEEDIVTKTPITQQGREIAEKEIAWYKKIADLKFANIPTIYDYTPLRMNKVKGKNIFEYSDLSADQKKIILAKIVDTIQRLHNLEEPVDAVFADVIENYLNKTFDRLEKVHDLIPFARDPYITINGRKCRNIFDLKQKVRSAVEKLAPEKFHLIHGDCTFSNLMFDSFREEVILIDPRGYFGHTKFYGDEYYDWAKLYYSLVGNYDQFNRKNFTLKMEGDAIQLSLGSNNWEDMEDCFFTLLPDLDRQKLKLIHALIWLSLTTYAWEDYDSICGAFYNGLLRLSEVME